MIPKSSMKLVTFPFENHFKATFGSDHSLGSGIPVILNRLQEQIQLSHTRDTLHPAHLTMYLGITN